MLCGEGRDVQVDVVSFLCLGSTLSNFNMFANLFFFYTFLFLHWCEAPCFTGIYCMWYLLQGAISLLSFLP